MLDVALINRLRALAVPREPVAVITVSLPESMVAELRDLAGSLGGNVSALVRELLGASLAQVREDFLKACEHGNHQEPPE